MESADGKAAETAGPRRRRRAVLAAVLAVLTLAVFGRALLNGFIDYDDPMYLTWNGVVREGIHLRGLAWALTTFHAGNWHPLTWLSHMADVSLFGMRPWGHHLTSMILHAANGALFLVALGRLTGNLWRSALAAAIFALHPLRVESVAWAAERKDVLAAFFAMVVLVLYASYARRPGRRAMAVLTAVFVLGLMAKPMLVSLPLLLLVLDYWPLARFRGTGPTARPLSRERVLPLLREKLPLLTTAAIAALIAFLAQQRSGALALHGETPAGLRLGNAVLSLVRYVDKAAWPRELIVFYAFPTGGIPPAAVLAAALSLATVTALALRLRKRPALVAGWLWYLVAVAPVLGFVQIGRQALADRYTYLPLLGLALAVAWGPGWGAPSRAARRALVAGAVGALGALSLLTWVQIGHWRDTATLFRKVVAVEPANAMGLNMVGVGLLERGDARGAESWFRAALRAEPGDPKRLYNLGLALLRLGELREATSRFLEAARTDPDYLDPRLQLGELLLSAGDPRGAADHLRAAVRLSPRDAALRFSLGNALDLSGDETGAVEQLREAIRLRPDFPEARNNLGAVLASQGRTEEAIAEFRETLRLRPGSREALTNLERLLGR